MRTTLLTAATVATLLGATAAPALAHHEHQLVNPGTTVVFKCEPAAAAVVHPIHYGLHMAFKHNVPAAAPITVGATGGKCLY